MVEIIGGTSILAAMVYVSEGRVAKTLEAIGDMAHSQPPAKLLHTFVDKPYNRSGFTVAGPSKALQAAVVKMTKLALACVDLSAHSATHPRLGSVDHVSVHPLKHASLHDAAACARDIGEAISASEMVPVYFYGAASPTGAALADLRRGLGYFKSSAKGEWRGGLLTGGPHVPQLMPDCGPSEIHPSKGVVTIGAVPWIVNYNIPIKGGGLNALKEVARSVREKGGGLPGVQAMALVHDGGKYEVACNILDAQITPPEALQAFLETHCKENLPEAVVESGYFPGLTPAVAWDRYQMET